MVKSLKAAFRFVYLFLLLIQFDIELSMKGFNKMFNNYALKYSTIQRTDWTDSLVLKYFAEIEEIFEILDIICTWYPRKADCVHKTLLGYRIIRGKYSIPVDMVVGLRKFPFQAHAWLIFDNSSFFGNEEDTSSYKIILNSFELIRGETG